MIQSHHSAASLVPKPSDQLAQELSPHQLITISLLTTPQTHESEDRVARMDVTYYSKVSREIDSNYVKRNNLLFCLLIYGDEKKWKIYGAKLAAVAWTLDA